MNGIYWLASYPKSGNTWTRAFLDNYLNNGEAPVNINTITDEIACNRNYFDEYIGLSSSDLDEEQIKLYQPYMYEELVKKSSADLYMKIHDAYTINRINIPLIPKSVTKGVIYILRNPLDVTVSYAQHSASTIDKAIHSLCDETFIASNSKTDFKKQLPQLFLSWSGHVKSWMESPLRIHLMRYEDMKADPYGSFRSMLEFMGTEIDEERLAKAVHFSSFEILREQEQKGGFREKPAAAQSFFRKGQIGSYREELSQEQIDTIVAYHRETMIKYGYLDEHNQLVY